MMKAHHRRTYESLAIEAARRAGVEPTPEGAAESPEARDGRDQLWAQYEWRLRDSTTYTLEACRAWLAEHGVKASISMISRDRRPVLERDEGLRLSAAITQRYLDTTADTSESQILAAARKVAGDCLFQMLSQAATGGLARMDAGDIRRLADAVGRLSTARAQTEMLDARLTEMRREYEARVTAAKRARKGGALTDSDLEEIGRAVFGDSR